MSLVTPVYEQETDRLLAPVDPQNPIGLFDIEDETFQAIDQEMVKLGGLQESSIDWLFIEDASRQYLVAQCKHFRIVGHLSAAWLRRGNWESWCCTLQLLAGMVERYWEAAHPKPGPKGFPGKRKMVDGALRRLCEALPNLDRFSHTPSMMSAAQQALSRLMQHADPARLDAGLLAELQRLLQAEAQEGRTPVPESPLRKVVVAPLADAFIPSKPDISLGNERETRRAVLSMAEFINQQDLYDPTGYNLRRFGIWGHIQAAPHAGQGNCTELMAVPVDISSVYEEALASRAIDPSLLLRVEKSVVASPYWVRGSFLAASIAARLAMEPVAEAIRAATARFVQRLPALQQLCFSDGTRFVDDQSLAWLKGGHAEPNQVVHTHEFRSLRERLAKQLDAQGIESVLLALQGLQADYRSPRERCHATVIAAELLAARGVSWLAQDLCASVALSMRRMTADGWEPELFQRLQQHGAASLLTDQEFP